MRADAPARGRAPPVTSLRFLERDGAFRRWRRRDPSRTFAEFNAGPWQRVRGRRRRAPHARAAAVSLARAHARVHRAQAPPAQRPSARRAAVRGAGARDGAPTLSRSDAALCARRAARGRDGRLRHRRAARAARRLRPARERRRRRPADAGPARGVRQADGCAPARVRVRHMRRSCAHTHHLARNGTDLPRPVPLRRVRRPEHDRLLRQREEPPDQRVRAGQRMHPLRVRALPLDAANAVLRGRAAAPGPRHAAPLIEHHRGRARAVEAIALRELALPFCAGVPPAATRAARRLTPHA